MTENRDKAVFNVLFQQLQGLHLFKGCLLTTLVGLKYWLLTSSVGPFDSAPNA